MDPLPWAWCVRDQLDSFSPSYLSLSIPNVRFGRTQPLCAQCCVFLCNCTAQDWRYLVFLMPVSGSYMQHSHWCEIVGGERAAEMDRSRGGGIGERRRGKRALFAQGNLQGQHWAHLWGGEVLFSDVVFEEMDTFKCGAKGKLWM